MFGNPVHLQSVISVYISLSDVFNSHSICRTFLISCHYKSRKVLVLRLSCSLKSEEKIKRRSEKWKTNMKGSSSQTWDYFGPNLGLFQCSWLSWWAVSLWSRPSIRITTCASAAWTELCCRMREVALSISRAKEGWWRDKDAHQARCST